MGITAMATSSANAELLTGLLYGQNTLETFDSAAPQTILNSVGVSGLSSDTLVGIDYLGSTLYGVGSGGHLYTINPVSGSVSSTVYFGSLSGTYFGMDASSAGIHIVSDSGLNLLLNTSGGTVSTGTLSPTGLNVSAVASYNGNTYAIGKDLSSQLGTLYTLSGNALTSVGGLQYQISRVNGFDISSGGYAYLVSEVGSGGSSPELFTVNLGTGIASLAGAFNLESAQAIGGLTVNPVPEPATSAMIILGGAGVFALIRRRK